MSPGKAPYRHSAFRTAVFFLLVLVGWLGIVRVWPDGYHLKVGSMPILTYPSWSSWWTVPNETMSGEAAAALVEEILDTKGTAKPEETKDVGGTAGTDEVGEARRDVRASPLVADSIPYLFADSLARAAMSACFARLRDSTATTPWHVFHFGDSQIEGDRFTATIRSRMQSTFGGQGPGWLSVGAPSPSFSVNLQTLDLSKWHRSTRYMTADSLIHDERYGWMAARCDADSGAAFEIRRHPRCSPAARAWNHMEMVFDTASQAMPLQWHNGAGSDWQDTTLLGSKTQLRRMTWFGKATDLPQEIRLPAGASRLLHVGMWTDSAAGVIVHNVPMRGSSGTLFTRLDRDVLADQIRHTSPALVFLQFGGNAVPYLQSNEAAQRYSRWFSANLRRIKSLMPEAVFVVIANADMSENVEGQWRTKAMVKPMRDALRDAAMAEHAVFFDLFEAMGGENSMPGWVAAEPQLAASDHVHFTRRGAGALAEMLMNALMQLDPTSTNLTADGIGH